MTGQHQFGDRLQIDRIGTRQYSAHPPTTSATAGAVIANSIGPNSVAAHSPSDRLNLLAVIK
jgi:hypothetical protein